jgi:hypothetical protein
MNKVLPDKFLSKMDKSDRAKLGKAGATAAECEAVQIARSEKELQNMIVTTLRREGIFVIQNRMDKRPTVAAGTPDLLFVVKGKPIAWECKMPGQKLRQDQLTAQTQMSHNGWLFDVIYTYDEALRLFNELNK